MNEPAARLAPARPPPFAEGLRPYDLEVALNAALLSRRGFVSGAGGLTAAVLLAPEAMAGKRAPRPSLRGGKFAEGVASGDPAPRGITLWTRVADVEGTGTVELQVARDRGFRKVVART